MGEASDLANQRNAEIGEILEKGVLKTSRTKNGGYADTDDEYLTSKRT